VGISFYAKVLMTPPNVLGDSLRYHHGVAGGLRSGGFSRR